MDVGATVEFVGDVKQTRLVPGMRGVVVRTGRRGVDVRFEGRGSVSTGIAEASLRVIAPPSDEERVRAFAESHGLPPGDRVSVLRTSIDEDAKDVYAAVIEGSAGLMTHAEQLHRVVQHDAIGCLALLWPKRVSKHQFLIETLPSLPCFAWTVPKCSDADILDVVRTLSSRFAFSGEARAPAWTVRLLEMIRGRGTPLPSVVADNLFRIYSGDGTKAVRDKVIDILTRRGFHHHAPSTSPCTICNDTAFEHVRVFTERGDGAVVDAGELCFDCFQKSTAVRNAMFGDQSVFESNTAGVTRFMMNRQVVRHVLHSGRLYTYAEFIGRFNQAAIGSRIRLPYKWKAGDR